MLRKYLNRMEFSASECLSENKNTQSASVNCVLLPGPTLLGCFVGCQYYFHWRFKQHNHAEYSSGTRTCQQRSETLGQTRPLTATILNINENLNIAVHRSRHMLFINKSQMRARRWVHNLGGRTVMQSFRGVLKHVALTRRQRRASAAAAGIPPADATAWF